MGVSDAAKARVARKVSSFFISFLRRFDHHHERSINSKPHANCYRPLFACGWVVYASTSLGPLGEVSELDVTIFRTGKTVGSNSTVRGPTKCPAVILPRPWFCSVASFVLSLCYLDIRKHLCQRVVTARVRFLAAATFASCVGTLVSGVALPKTSRYVLPTR